MKKLIVAALAAAGLAGCIAVPGPYYGDAGGYYPGPAVGVGVYSAPGYYDGGGHYQGRGQGHGYGHGYRHRDHHRW